MTFRDAWVRHGSRILSIMLSLIIVGLVSSLIAVIPGEQRWANLSEFHAQWDVVTNTIEASVVLDKHQQCRRIIVNKALRPLVGNDVLPDEIPINGKFADHFQEAQLGVSVLFNRARPRAPVPPGQYLVTMTALCEAPSDGKQAAAPVVAPPSKPLASPTSVTPTPELLATEPIRALIVVPKIPIRIIPKRTRSS